MTMNLKGFYFDEQGAAVSGATARYYTAIQGTPTSVLGTATTNSNGYWEFTGVANGTYDVKLSHPTSSSVRWLKGLSSPPVNDDSFTVEKLIPGPLVCAFNASTQNVGTSATLLTFPQEIFDTSSAFGSGLFTVPITGRYLVQLSGLLQWSSACTPVSVNARVNGVDTQTLFAINSTGAGSTGMAPISVNYVTDLTATNTFGISIATISNAAVFANNGFLTITQIPN